MAITINDTTTPTRQNQGGATKTGPPALKLTPEHNLINTSRHPGHDRAPNWVLNHWEASEEPRLPVNQIDATHQSD